MILYFTYSYHFKNKDELRSAVKGYPGNMKQYGNSTYWDVSNVTDMRYMFQYSEFNGDISEWDVSNITNIDYMFCKSQFNGDVSKWKVKP